MTTRKLMMSQYTLDQPQPLLEAQNSSKNRFAEFAGGTTAECAAVCCCFPFALVNLLFLAAYGVPAVLYRKVLQRKRRRKLIKKGLLIVNCGGGDVDSAGDRSSCEGAELLFYQSIEFHAPVEVMVDSDVIELENEMWDKFYESGFWRSGSHRVE